MSELYVLLKMKAIDILMAGTLLLALYSCEDSVENSGVAVWPSAPDGFEWPVTKDDPIEFETLANASIDSDVKKASETLKSRHSLEEVTFARSDLNADGRNEILIKVHNYGFTPSYVILTPNDSGYYSDIGRVSGGQILSCEGDDGWRQVQTRSADDQIRQLYAFKEGIYHLIRSEQLDPSTNMVTVLVPNKAEQDAAGNPLPVE